MLTRYSSGGTAKSIGNKIFFREEWLEIQMWESYQHKMALKPLDYIKSPKGECRDAQGLRSGPFQYSEIEMWKRTLQRRLKEPFMT